MTHPLQTKEWREFRKEWGNIVESSKAGLIIFSKIPYTKFTIGTLIRGAEPTKKDILEIAKIGREKNCIFIKLEPDVTKNNKLVKALKTWGLK